VQTLGRIRDAKATVEEIGREELSARVLQVRGASLNVGAVRTVQLIDFLWSGRCTPEDVNDLHAALVIELGAFEQALQSRTSSHFATAGGFGR
jgi:hypothetical protein